MKKFLSSLFLFSSTTIIVIIILVISTAKYAISNFDFSIPKEKNILVLGNSRPEHALNDSIFENAYNLAQGGSGYFYDFLKIREMVKHNPQIDTLIIGYSHKDLEKDMDLWFSGEDKIKFKMRNYLFLFDFKDYLSLLKSNYRSVLTNTPSSIFHNIKMKYKGKSYLGGYQPQMTNKIVKAKELFYNQKPEDLNGYSKYQSEYLIKIYEFCMSKKIAIILIDFPIHPLLNKRNSIRKDLYCKFAKEKMPNALLLNHSDFKLPDTYYRDLTHLNKKGAELYTEYLKSTKFKTGQSSYCGSPN